MEEKMLFVNEGKQKTVGKVDDRHDCYAVKTKTITEEDSIETVVYTYLQPMIKPRDIVFISEKMIACMQGRAILLNDIHCGFWAKCLSRFVKKTKYGIGLAMPETMQCAIVECGLPRVLFAALVGAVGKILQQNGWFYYVAGRKAAAIDGPCEWTIPPYNNYVVLAPKEPNEVAKQVSRLVNGNLVLVVDLNDIGGEILGASEKLTNKDYLLSMLKQNPLGQKEQSTPIGILRPREQPKQAL